MKIVGDRRLRVVGSTPLGAGLGALAMVLAVLGAVWVTGYVEAFSANRGLLQLLVAIPLASLLAAGALAFCGVLTRPQMLWAMLPVAGLIALGIGALGPGYRAWPWLLALGVAVFVPWIAGLSIGTAWRRSA